MLLKIKPSRKTEILEEIDAILDSHLLPPGLAGKLRGETDVRRITALGKDRARFLEGALRETVHQGQPSSAESSDHPGVAAVEVAH